MASPHKKFEFDPKSFTYYRQGKLRFFCPLCSQHQSTNTIERVAWQHHLQLALLTLATTLVAWPFFGIDGLLFYLVWWAGFEVVYRLRKREALVCRNCGFDPFLYKRDPKVARKAVQAYWQDRIERDGLFEGLKLKNYKTKAKASVANSALQNKDAMPIESDATTQKPLNGQIDNSIS
jgi:hypothetical protein